jgi:hypothetical protein
MRRAKPIAGPNQLSLFNSFSASSRRYDNLLERLSLQAANLRYLITRIQYCDDLPIMKRAEITHVLENLLYQFQGLCDELKKGSNRYYCIDFKKAWAYKEYVQITDASAFPSVETLFSHLTSCQTCFNSVKIAVDELLYSSGKVVDNIKYEYQNLISDNAFQSPRLQRYLYP